MPPSTKSSEGFYKNVKQKGQRNLVQRVQLWPFSCHCSLLRWTRMGVFSWRGSHVVFAVAVIYIQNASFTYRMLHLPPHHLAQPVPPFFSWLMRSCGAAREATLRLGRRGNPSWKELVPSSGLLCGQGSSLEVVSVPENGPFKAQQPGWCFQRSCSSGSTELSAISGC